MLNRQSSEPSYAGRPSVCRNCGALVGAGEDACAQCGTPLKAASAPPLRPARRPIYDRESLRFARAIFKRPATFTFVFLIANIFVFLLMYLSGGAESGSMSQFPSELLIAYGAKVNFLIDKEKEYWRFVTPIFIHGGLLHLFFNMYGLWVLGPYVERLYGSAKFVVFWVVTGIAGVVASYLTLRPDMDETLLGRFLFKSVDAASVGASGALFGLIGVLFVFGIKFRHELPGGFKRAFGTGMLPTILINIFIGFAIPVIDNAAHLGGLIAGAILALFVGYKRPHERASVAVTWHVLQVAALVLVAVSFFEVERKYAGIKPPLDRAASHSATGSASDIQTYLKAIENGGKAFVLAFNEGNVTAVEPALAALDRSPRLDAQADLLRNQLKYMLWRVYLLNQAEREQRFAPSALREERENLGLAFQSWQERYALWGELNGRKYGLIIQKQAPQNAPDDKEQK